MLQRFFSFKGRLNRKPYWLLSLAVFGLMILASLVIGLGFAGLGSFDGTFGFGPGMSVLMVVLAATVIVMYVAIASIAVRRLHDRNRSGWWIGAYIVVSIILAGLQEGFGQGGGVGLTVSVISIILALWYFVELGFLRGTAGPNRYGPDPLGGGQADPSLFE